MKDYFENKLTIPFTKVTLSDHKKILSSISKIITTGDFILGKDVHDFEHEFASYIGTTHCVGVASGTDAILLALKALDIAPGDEVIVPAFTFVATATPLLMIGAKPVYVDIKANLPVIDEQKIEQAITKKTKAIIVVHLYGFACDMSNIQRIAKKHGLCIIEDASQAHGTRLGKKRVGTFSDISVFSFYPTKNLGAFGDAGAILTSRTKIYKKLLLLRNHGQITKYRYTRLGYNSRLDSIQAAVLRSKLTSLEQEIKNKEKIIHWYEKHLSGLPVEVFTWDRKRMSPALHVFVIRTLKRDALSAYLKKQGISCLVHYPKALPDEEILASDCDVDYPQAQNYAATVLSLPFFSGMKKGEVVYVCKNIKNFFRLQEE